MELSKKKLEDLISAVDKIVAANSQQEPSLLMSCQPQQILLRFSMYQYKTLKNLTIYIMGIFKSF